MIAQLLAPWRRSLTWRSLGHLVTGMVAGGPFFGVMVALLATSVGLLFVLPLAIPVIWVLFAVGHGLATLERSRFAALLDVVMVDPVPPSTERSWWRGLVEKARSSARWREIAYLLLLLPLGLFTGGVAVGVWTGSAALAALPFFVERLPEGTAEMWLFDIGPGAGAVAASLLGVIGLVVLAPWITVALAALCRQVGSWLLSTDPTEALEGRVSALETSRTAAVDSAEAERRRIERDLHDGAQQRLVALAMDLGTAQERLQDETPEVRALVDAAHSEVKGVIKELRDLVRGIHPVILEDRGLDAALSAVVARFPIPVTLQVEVARRPPATVESTAYFVVSEALTNVVRHAEATQAAVAIARRGDRLVVEVRDDGIGGADPSRGTGLRGLADRAASVGGWMEVVSPPGGPTTVVVELPCGS